MSKKSTNKREAGSNWKSIKQEEALARDAEWAKLSPEKQLADLDRRLGKNVGAVRQRARISAKLKQLAREQQITEQTEKGASNEKKQKGRKQQPAERGS